MNRLIIHPLIMLISLSFLFFLQPIYAANDAGIKVNWGYRGNIGPEKWAQLDPSFVLCARGKSQSPINIVKKVITVPHALSINYTAAPLDIINDGFTELLIGNQQTIIDDGHAVQVNFSENAKESIQFDGKNYRLIQFHIHTPSENQWQGRSFPMEIHFVHQGDNGQVAVVGVFVQGGQENSELKKIIDNLPAEKGKEQSIKGTNIDPLKLLPEKQSYYNFVGSLTTPPCSEGLEWVVMANAITASPAQIANLKKAMGGNNARPVQPRNHRHIYFSD